MAGIGRSDSMPVHGCTHARAIGEEASEMPEIASRCELRGREKIGRR